MCLSRPDDTVVVSPRYVSGYCFTSRYQQCNLFLRAREGLGGEPGSLPDGADPTSSVERPDVSAHTVATATAGAATSPETPCRETGRTSTSGALRLAAVLETPVNGADGLTEDSLALSSPLQQDLPEVVVEAVGAVPDDLPELVMEAIKPESKPRAEVAVDTLPLVTSDGTRPILPGRLDPTRISAGWRAPDAGAMPAQVAGRSGLPVIHDREPADDPDDWVEQSEATAPVIAAPSGGRTATSGSMTLTGRAEPGSRVLIRDWTVLVGESMAAADGEWSITLHNLRDGAHMYTAVAVDPTGSITSTRGGCLVTVQAAKGSAVLEVLRRWTSWTVDRASRRRVIVIALVGIVVVAAAVVILLVTGRLFHT